MLQKRDRLYLIEGIRTVLTKVLILEMAGKHLTGRTSKEGFIGEKNLKSQHVLREACIGILGRPRTHLIFFF